MLEFLGLEKEATQVLICFAVIGFACMLPLGCAAASGDTESEKGKYGGVVLMVICAILGIGAVIMGILPAIALFFTFQWKTLITGVFYALLTGAAGYGLGYCGTMSSRKRKYAKNPIMKEAVAYCRENGIVAVQCFDDRIRFFRDLENREYCESYTNTHMAADILASNSFKKGWTRPAAWCDYDRPRSFAGAIIFADRDWPRIPDLDLFAKVLAKQLGGCRVAEHIQRDQYDTTKLEGNTRTTTHHITLLYSDRFVYKKAALDSKYPPAPKQQPPKVKQPKGNSWE